MTAKTIDGVFGLPTEFSEGVLEGAVSSLPLPYLKKALKKNNKESDLSGVRYNFGKVMGMVSVFSLYAGYASIIYELVK